MPAQSLRQIVRERIAQSPQQRLSFAEFMDLALYEPSSGYYASGMAQIGARGDFFTSPCLGSYFGELLAEQFVEMWKILGKPAPFTLLEMGAGTGNLAADILAHLRNCYPELFQVLEYRIVEKSQTLKEQQEANLTHHSNVFWNSWEEIPESSLLGCIFSNEFIDALPVHVITIVTGKMQEVFVSFSENELKEVIADISTAKILEYFQLIDINLLSLDCINGYRTEVNLSALSWLETVAEKLRRGYLLTIDYGYPAHKYYHPQRERGTLKCYSQHRHHDNPYVNLGQQDITAHVDFTALERYGNILGLETLGFTRQGMFLMALGLGERLSELASDRYNLQQVLQRRDALHQLINPIGLGGFGVLLQTRGLEEEEKRQSLKGLRGSFPP